MRRNITIKSEPIKQFALMYVNKFGYLRFFAYLCNVHNEHKVKLLYLLIKQEERKFKF